MNERPTSLTITQGYGCLWTLPLHLAVQGDRQGERRGGAGGGGGVLNKEERAQRAFQLWRFYDPEYFVDFLFKELKEFPIMLVGGPAGRASWSVAKPQELTVPQASSWEKP